MKILMQMGYDYYIKILHNFSDITLSRIFFSITEFLKKVKSDCIKHMIYFQNTELVYLLGKNNFVCFDVYFQNTELVLLLGQNILLLLIYIFSFLVINGILFFLIDFLFCFVFLNHFQGPYEVGSMILNIEGIMPIIFTLANSENTHYQV